MTESWHHKTMKHCILIAALSVVTCIACTYKSADSRSLPVNTVAEQSPTAALATPTNATQNQENTPCALTIAPAIKGLKLGMTADEVLALFPGSKDDQQIKSVLSSPVDELGVSSFAITPAKYESPAPAFSDVSSITFTFFDGHVFKMYISYRETQWPSVDKFVEHFVEGTEFPAAGRWSDYPGMENQMKMLQCTGIEVRAFAAKRITTYVEIHDLAAEKKMNDREKKLLKKPRS